MGERERTNLSLLRADLYNHSKGPKNNNNGIEGIFLLFKRFGSFSKQGACEHRLMKRFFLTHNWVPIEARLSNAEQKPSRIEEGFSQFLSFKSCLKNQEAKKIIKQMTYRTVYGPKLEASNFEKSCSFVLKSIDIVNRQCHLYITSILPPVSRFSLLC